jgi:hypothetical protein
MGAPAGIGCPGIRTVLIFRSTIIRVQSTGDPVRHRHHVVSVRADAIRRLENPDAYAQVPRRMLSSDGRTRPWAAAGLITRDTPGPADEFGQDDSPG